MATSDPPTSHPLAIESDHFVLTFLDSTFTIAPKSEPERPLFTLQKPDHLIDLGNLLAIAQDILDGISPAAVAPRLLFVRDDGGVVFATWGPPPCVDTLLYLPGETDTLRAWRVETLYSEHGFVTHHVSVRAADQPVVVGVDPAAPQSPSAP